jgi:hypothetical protein
MRCISCGGEMRLVLVERDDTMMVPGYEHQTVRCSGCNEVERRLVFSGESGSRPAEPALVPSTPVTSLLLEADRDLDEGEELLRRAIEMVRGPTRLSQPIRGLTDGRPETAAELANSMRAKRSAPGRIVQIRHEPSDEAAYVAKDTTSGLVVLRHQDSARLRAMCDRLGWQVVDADADVPSADN